MEELIELDHAASRATDELTVADGTRDVTVTLGVRPDSTEDSQAGLSGRRPSNASGGGSCRDGGVG
jgi:hypothetical protein